MVLPIVSALLALTVLGYWTYIQRGQWTPDHLISVVGIMLEGASAVFGIIFDVLKWIAVHHIGWWILALFLLALPLASGVIRSPEI